VVKHRRKKKSTLVRLVTYVAIFMLVLSAALAGSAFWYLERHGGLIALLERNLSSPDDDLDIKIGAISWRLQWSETPFVLNVSDVDVSLGTQALTLPESTLYFGARSLATNGQPEILVVQGLDVNLTQSAQGWDIQNSDLGVDAAVNFNSLAEQLQNVAPKLGLRQILLQIEKIQLQAETDSNDEALVLDEATIVLDISDLANMQAKFRARQVSLEGTNGHISIDLDGDLLSRYWQISITAKAIEAAAFVRQLPSRFSLADYIIFEKESRISGNLLSSFDGRNMQTATIDLSMSDARLQLSPLSGEGGKFASLQLSAAYSLADNVVNITRAEMELADKRRLSINGQLLNLHGEQVSLAGTVLAQNISLKSILDDWPETAAPQVRKQLDSILSSGLFPSLLMSFSGDYNPQLNALSLSELTGKGRFSGVRLNAGYGQYRSIVGTVGGELDITLGAGGQVKDAQIDAMMENGFLIADGLDAPVQLPKAGLNARFQPGNLFVETLFADFGDQGDISGNMTITLPTADNDTLTFAAGLSSETLDVDLFQYLWPDTVTQKTIQWVRRRIQGGELADVSMRLQALKPNGKKVEFSDITGQGKLIDTSFTWVDDSPKIKSIDANLSILNNQYNIEILKGDILNSNVEKGTITLSPLVAPSGVHRDVRVQFSSAGSLKDLVDLLDHPTVNRLPATVKALDFADGDTRSTVKFRSLLANGQLSTTELQAASIINTDSVGGLPYNGFLDEARLSVAVENDRIMLEGRGQYQDIPLQFTLRSDQADDIFLSVDVPNNDRITTYLAASLGAPISGSASAKIMTNFRPNQDVIRLKIEADLAKSGFHLPLVNFAKLPGEAGTANLILEIENDRIKAVDDLKLTLGSLSTEGRLFFGESILPKAGILKHLAMPGYDIDEFVFEQLDDGTIQLTAAAERFDLKPLLNRTTVAGATNAFPEIKFDLTSDRMQVSDTIALTGSLKGQTDEAMKGDATLLGDILIEGRPLITEATIKALLSDDGPVLDGVGLIGGAETRLSFSTAESGLPVLILSSSKAGRVLRGLGIADVIRGGRLRLVNQFTNDALSDYDTTIELEEFNVIEAPAAIRAFSVLSLSGLYSLVEGDGTRFTRGEGRIKTRNGVHEFDVLKATGGAVGVYMVGSFDRNSGAVDVSGNLVPVNQFSKILGVVPVLGELLTGLDKSGLFATQFSLTGQIDDPDVRVNAASIAPGLLRDLFSPNWLGSEEERILTPDNATN